MRAFKIPHPPVMFPDLGGFGGREHGEASGEMPRLDGEYVLHRAVVWETFPRAVGRRDLNLGVADSLLCAVGIR